jgi:hypothetical protein
MLQLGEPMKELVLLMIVAAAGAFASPARADENPFVYNYTADIEDRGETEAALWITDRRGKSGGQYDAQDYRLELEHGFTDRFSAATYAMFASHHITGMEPQLDSVRRDFAFQGLSAEFKYELLDDDKDGVGFTVYAEPGWSRIHDVEGSKGAEYELELKAIFSKGFDSDRVVWAANLTFEPEWEHERDKMTNTGRWNRELKLAASTGVAYRLLSNVYLGAEARYSGVYPDWTNGLRSSASAFFAGPTISFSAGEWSGALSYLPQLGGSPSQDGGRNLGEFESREVRLRIAHEF